jgi:2-iminobutanoate/2-iminopropanoate deaminase
LSDPPRHVFTERAPRPVGPYSQAVVHGGVAYLAGQVALDPATGKVRGETIEEQTEQVLANLGAVLAAAGTSWDRVLRTGVFLADMSEFARFNAVYARVLGDARPARSTIAAATLPLGLRVEVDAIAAVPGKR